MKIFKFNRKAYWALLVSFVVLISSCTDYLIELNENPNGAEPNNAHPNLVVPSVLSEAAKLYLNLGYQDLAGVMQHTQKDGWNGAHNNYDWEGSNSWNGYYDILRNNKFVLERSEELGYELHQGVALVMKSFMFGLLADLWGDVPYSEALLAQEGGTMTAKYDRQEDVYLGVIADLERANQLLSKPAAQYTAQLGNADLYFGGNPAKWQRFANSLMLRYYMRLSHKSPDFARAGIEKIAQNPSDYPLILVAADDATMGFPGTNGGDSWPYNVVFYSSDQGSDFRRIKMAHTLVEHMRAEQDPRLGVWARRVQIPIKVDDSLPTGTDEVVDGIRMISPDRLAALGANINQINQNHDFVGLPTSLVGPQAFNLSPDVNQASNNPHVSWLNDMYREPSGPLLRARLLSAVEVNLILAEAALKGWNTGDAQARYEAGVKASFDTWGLAGQYEAYIAGAPYQGTIQQIIEQKWVSSWTAAAEAWFDWRRTGFPDLQTGSQAMGPVLPVRFYYMASERELNKANTEQATANLESTEYTSYGAVGGAGNSAWSKPWVLQGTGNPW